MSTMAAQQQTARESEKRRKSILVAAQALLVEEGMEGFRIREVAQRIGIHHASLLHYFPNREALIRGVVEQIVEQLDRVPGLGAASNALPPQDALHLHFQHVLAQMREQPALFIALNELFRRAERDEEVRRILTATDVSWSNYLMPLLQSGIATGAFRTDLNPHVVAVLIMSVFKGLSTQLTLTTEEIEAAVTQLERWICQE